MLILRNATIGMTRSDEFRSDLGIADNILSERLGRLVESGLLTRVPYREQGRTRHEYRLTAAGADVLPVLRALFVWGENHTEPAEPEGSMRVLHSVCGRDVAADGRCDHCGRRVARAEELWVRPWRSPERIGLASAME